MRILKMLWEALNNLRRAAQLVFLFLILALIVAGLTVQEIEVPESAALVIAPVGMLVDQLEGDPIERAIAEARGIQMQQTLLQDVVDSLELAVDDDRIKAIVLELDGLEGGGLAKLQAIGDSLERLREAGKPIFAVGDSFTQNQYYLAAHADEIYMHELGALIIDGFAYYRAFLKAALEKLKVDVNVFRVGKYKSFLEPFTRNDMSEDDRQASERWLGALWATYTRDVEVARELEPGSVDAFANEFVKNLAGTGGNSAQVALDAGFVDFVGGRRDYVERVIELAGPAESDDEAFSGIGMNAYLAAVDSDRSDGRSDEMVGVLVAAGEIVDGEAPRGTIGGDTLANLVRSVADDDSIKALVLRVDSPGGSMFASDIVFGALQRLKSKGKPLVVSMSATAASGGYYISMPADEIWAGEGTITGSIGVGALIPTFQRTLGELGVTTDGLGTTSLAGQLRLDRPLGDDARQALQLSVDEAYRVFVGKVAKSRDMSLERVRNAAQGRVWIGSDALELGLIDRLGTLDDAIASAAEMAGLVEGGYDVEFVEPELSLRERIALQLAARMPGIVGFVAGPGDDLVPGWFAGILQTVRRELGWLATLNDPRNLYYHCFCQLP